MNKCIFIKTDVYKSGLFIFINTTPEKAHDYVIEAIDDENLAKDTAASIMDICKDSTGSGISSFNPTINTGVIYINEFKKNDSANLGTLSHEIFHVAHRMLSSYGMVLSEDSDEAYAYLIGYLTRRFYDLI